MMRGKTVYKHPNMPYFNIKVEDYPFDLMIWLHRAPNIHFAVPYDALEKLIPYLQKILKGRRKEK